MKLIKKPQPVKLNLSDKYKVGQQVKVITEHHDETHQRCYNQVKTLYTIDKVNRVTIDITNAAGYTYRFNPVSGCKRFRPHKY